jgi:prepilin-type N-terminal cleavage/methylation domain-containing protein
MKLKLTRRVRTGFTLIELLVVIAIIAILMSLLAAAVLKIIGVGPKTTTRVEIGQLEQAMETFKTKFKADYVPSRIRLCEKRVHYNQVPTPAQLGGPKLDQESMAFLEKVFPKLVDPNNPPGSANEDANPWTSSKTSVWVDWNGSGTLDVPSANNNYLILEGDQCLVFFLGGIPTRNPNGTLGFSTNPRNPAQQGGDRIQPFYEFKSNRLLFTKAYPFGSKTAQQSFDFLSYIDAYGKKPYVYFSAYKGSNGYNRYFPVMGISECLQIRKNPLDGNEIPQTVWPYAEALTPIIRYQKPNGFQIISAGADGLFGPGTDLTSQMPLTWPVTTVALPQPGFDDQANFAPRILGAGPD